MSSLEAIAENFEFLQDWDDRYQYLMDLGQQSPGLDDAQKTPENLLQGCTSQVWMIADFDGPGATLRLALDSDAPIVRGLLALMVQIYAGKTRQQVLDTDIAALLRRLALLEHLSPSRRHGMQSMIRKIQGLAASA